MIRSTTAHLEEGIHRGGGREHREGANPKKSEQQAATDAETLKHRGNTLGPTDAIERPCTDLPQMPSSVIGGLLFQGHVLATPPDIPYPALNREVALFVEIDPAQ